MSATSRPPSFPSPEAARAFRRRIFTFYRRHGRRQLPFRNTTDPYCILVAEIMLQQTQVERVIPKWQAWITRWPDFTTLAGASTRDVLAAWSGLGYNRRALNLHRTATIVARDFEGSLPRDPQQLVHLPGIGPYTAHAVLIFAFNAPLVAIDANIRRVLFHEFNCPPGTPEAHLQELATMLLPPNRSRDWHNALMDYSRLALPRTITHLAPRYRQGRFEGSLRQIRGEIIRRLTTRTFTTIPAVARAMNCPAERVHKAARALERESIITIALSRIKLSGD
jgi:A/G-specific adenine glycosylase